MVGGVLNNKPDLIYHNQKLVLSLYGEFVEKEFRLSLYGEFRKRKKEFQANVNSEHAKMWAFRWSLMLQT